jgi:hypothetical protein
MNDHEKIQPLQAQETSEHTFLERLSILDHETLAQVRGGIIMDLAKTIAYQLGSPANITSGHVLNKIGNIAVKGTVAGSLVTIAAVEVAHYK